MQKLSGRTRESQAEINARLPIPMVDVLAWCGRCRTVSTGAAWGRGGQCPHCAETLSARFWWDDLRRIKPRLPQEPPAGLAINVYEF